VSYPPLKDEHSNLTPVVEMLELDRFHHHKRTSAIATQFCTFELKRRDGDKSWMATHPSDYDGTFPKISAATKVYLDHRDVLAFRDGRVFVELVNPVLVVAGEIFTCSPGDSSNQPDPMKADRVLYRHWISSERGIQDLYIDVVTEDGLDSYLDDCRSEFDELMKGVLSRHRELVVAATAFRSKFAP
jgi:hypothetical protein